MRISEPHTSAQSEPAFESEPVSALPSLAWLLHMLSGDAIAVQLRTQPVPHGALARPVLDAEHGLFLPDSQTMLADAAHWSQQRAAIAHAAAHWRYSPRKQSGRGLKPMGHAVVGALEDARVECLLGQEFPGVKRWFSEAFAPVELHDDFPGLLARLHCALADETYADDHGWIIKARTLFNEIRQRGDLNRPQPLRDAASILANDLGQMRLRMNLQTFHVPAAYRDDNMFLWDLGENASDPPPEMQSHVEMRQQEMRKSAAPDDGDQQEVQISQPIDPVPFFYPEWDCRLERARPDWCSVYERQPLLLPTYSRAKADAAQSIRNVWRTSVRTDRHIRLRRQLQGDELDLDAAIDWSVDRRARRDPSPNIFRDVGRAAPLLNLLVLVDLSQSCNDTLAGQGDLSLLDLQKQALVMLARRVDRRSVRLAIHGFHSDTRKSVSYFRLLEFAQTFDSESERAINALQAGYSTRLGAALRHASHVVAAEPVGHRAIVVVSDGVPSDVDVFDPQYLAADARAAVRSAQRSGVHVAALGVGEVDASQMRQIYGQGEYLVAHNPLELPQRLTGLIARLVH